MSESQPDASMPPTRKRLTYEDLGSDLEPRRELMSMIGRAWEGKKVAAKPLPISVIARNWEDCLQLGTARPSSTIARNWEACDLAERSEPPT